MTLDAPAEATDDTHGRYWRAIDDFFLPNLASAVTRPHVLRVHAFDMFGDRSSLAPTFQSGRHFLRSLRMRRASITFGTTSSG
jgi:hypothetical protein